MGLKVLFIIYDNGSFDHVFPMGVGAISAILKRDGHEVTLWNQDMHHWQDDELRTYLDKNKLDVVIFSLIAGYYQIQIRFLAMERSMGEIHAEQIILSQKVSAMEKEHLKQLESQNEVLEQENRSLMQRIGLKK